MPPFQPAPRTLQPHQFSAALVLQWALQAVPSELMCNAAQMRLDCIWPYLLVVQGVHVENQIDFRWPWYHIALHQSG
jgi:hypothetical protein